MDDNGLYTTWPLLAQGMFPIPSCSLTNGLQGYGLTETCGASFIAQPRGGHSGTVGPPLASLELRFEGSEELGYNPNGEPPRGEILIRGPALFGGYFKDEEKTKDSIGLSHFSAS